MKNQEIFKKELYQTLGSLFYAVAYVDGSVSRAEVVKLESMVKERWLNDEEDTDDYGSDAAYQIISVFDWMDSEKISFDKAYGVFTRFYGHYAECIDDSMKEKIIQTTIDISLAFGGENSREHRFIEGLRSLLNMEALECKM